MTIEGLDRGVFDSGSAASPVGPLTGKKIALVMRLLAGRSGGAERLLSELANFLVASGADVEVVTYDDVQGLPFFPLDPKVRLVNLAPRQLVYGGVSSLSRTKRWLFTTVTQSALGPLVNKRAWNMVSGDWTRRLTEQFASSMPDLAISFLPTANTAALLAGRESGIKVIPTNHNLPQADYFDPARWDPNPYDRALRLDVLQYAAAIHVLFPAHAKGFPAKLRDRIVAIPNYVSPIILHHRSGEKRDSTIMAAGRLMPVKNYRMLVEAWSSIARRHPEWRVKVFGDGAERPLLEAQIQRLGLQDSVILEGRRSDLETVYAKASIFCHPALFEGFGLSAAEALASGVPVVAFADCEGVNEFAVDGFNAVMVDRKAGATGLAAALESLIVDEGKRRELARNAPGSVQGFSETEYQRRWLELIERTLA